MRLDFDWLDPEDANTLAIIRFVAVCLALICILAVPLIALAMHGGS